MSSCKKESDHPNWFLVQPNIGIDVHSHRPNSADGRYNSGYSEKPQHDQNMMDKEFHPRQSLQPIVDVHNQVPRPNSTDYPYFDTETYVLVVDEECGPTQEFTAFTEKSIRLLFIRKVLAILMAQMLITCGFIAVILYHEPSKEFVRRHFEIAVGALLVVIVTLLSLQCSKSLRRKSPANYIFLLIFTLAESFFVGFIVSNYTFEEVLMAVGLTAGVCFSLMIFAFQTKLDFTTYGGILFTALTLLITVGIAAIFIGGKVVGLIYASFGALLFCVYLVFDIQLMTGGGHKYAISPEEYIFAAINIYIDIIHILLYILRILGYFSK